MSVQQLLLGAGSGASGYNIEKSLRFRGSASGNLSKTFSSGGDTQKWTWSGWVKRGTLSSSQVIFNGGTFFATDTGWSGIAFIGDTLMFEGWTTVFKQSSAVYRDTAAWYHIVCAVDTTQATASNRVRFYVNGSEIVNYTVNNPPAQNSTTAINTASLHGIAGQTGAIGYSNSDMYMAEQYFIGGQQLTPSSFGSTNALTGVWQPAPYTGTYGTNGFYLKFTNTSSVAALGTDFSGNSNTWTVNNISLTAGVTYDSMTDVPTLTSATVSNFPVLNRILPAAGLPDIRDANLFLRCADPSNFTAIPATMLLPKTGKWYAEFTAIYVDGATSPLDIGLLGSTDFPTPSGVIGASATSYAYRNNGNKLNNSVLTAYGASYVIGDIIAIAFDATAGTLTFYKNNVSQGVAFTGLTAEYFFAIGGYNFAQWQANFGQRPFSYTPPTGFVALNTFNLPTSTIVKGNTQMDATLYTGTGASLAVTNAAGFQPDFVWLKGRSSAYNHALFDSIRGVNKVLFSNGTSSEQTEVAGSLSAFNSNGFTLAAGVAAHAAVNVAGQTFVGWQWKAGGAASSNTNGSITSQVSANPSAGFSVVTYTGTGSAATVGHGLGVAPKMIIVKSRSASGQDWRVYTAMIGNTGAINLNNTDPAITGQSGFWNNTSPTSSVFSVGGAASTNGNGTTYVAYCWSEIDGFSKFGSYIGNGSADGPFMYTGFRPKFLLVKRTNTAANWRIVDTSRNPYNYVNQELYPNVADVETTAFMYLDILSNGFKPGGTEGGFNGSGDSYIYAAFAENPFKNSLAR